jgi:hypothetical protein
MKLIVEVQLPKEFEELAGVLMSSLRRYSEGLDLLGQAARIYSEGAMAFPPQETSTSANVPTAESAADSALKPPKSSKRKKDSPTESSTASESAVQSTSTSPASPSPKTESTPQSNLSAAVETPLPTLNDVKVKVMSLENGHALATGLLKKMGRGKLSELSGHELVDFLSQLGVA